MRIGTAPHDMHIFVCQHSREGERASCGARWNASDAVAELKRLCKEKSLPARVSGSGCLGPCEMGPNIMVYPQKTWFHEVGLADLPAIVDHLVDNRGIRSSDSGA
ncbi:MAG TPA: (2Fe-2S) ferredoxin domain-containing protein [Fibrobacteria bacterium]|nr:(2Fe-2S) ferredoxin domain-containing protein [Fibrobacteria bacterium]